MRCPFCAGHVGEANIKKKQVGICPSCRRLFVANEGSSPPHAQRGHAANQTCPQGISVDRSGEQFRLRRSWVRHRGLLFISFVVGASLLLCFGLFQSGGWGATLALFIVAPIMMCMLYIGFAELLNTTTITIKNGTMKVRHGPVPWLGNHTLSAKQIDQLYCVEIERKTKQGRDYSYEVRAQLVSGQGCKLVKKLPYPDDAKAIERALEEHLGIVSRPVPGEI